MVPSSKTAFFSISDISVVVRTKNQSIKNQPCIWLVHGSGGISSNEDIWIKRAEQEGYTVIIVDSYTNRGIFKQYWDKIDEYRIDAKQRAKDQIDAYNFLCQRKSLIPFANIENSICVGFSDGGLSVIWLQNKCFPNFWRYSHSLYPPLKNKFSENLADDLLSSNVYIYVGDKDDWTPAKYCLEFKEKTNCNLKIFKDTYHSFSKPGINHFHSTVLNDTGNRGVNCKYSIEATQYTMNAVFETK